MSFEQTSIIENSAKQEVLVALYDSIQTTPAALPPNQLVDLINGKSFGNLADNERAVSAEQLNEFANELYKPILAQNELKSQYHELYEPAILQTTKNQLIHLNQSAIATLTGETDLLPFEYFLPVAINPQTIFVDTQYGKKVIEFLEKQMPHTDVFENAKQLLSSRLEKYENTYQNAMNEVTTDTLTTLTIKPTQETVEPKPVVTEPEDKPTINSPVVIDNDDTGPSI